ncbi:low molecular weight protein-tyrosine-phosphatase [Algisphaera agarilytica]|uniref:Protein-tyrosine phosphatase n=1 Tax=Algisphaera agarilytica TaxID=1385975 RepID=A0A7X0H3G9_9BACT|nr:low molecular weight protein-tyrosine-phosphatase [Algisphaera agarilytica]MBB6428383.1 protein-tyrosine phosphatase [Algisphaera agarilytica]
MTQDSKSVLFVCMGNICRSPTGEGVFQGLVDERGLSRDIVVDSAGTIGYHTGNPADQRMQTAAEKRGYRLTSRARKVTQNDIESFTLIVAMDRANYDDLAAMTINDEQLGRIKMLGEFLPGVSWSDRDEVRSVPDPYYGGAAGFEEVLDMIESACPAILEHLTGESDAA